MRVRYEHKTAMTFIGFSTSINPEESYSKCPEFWDKEYTQKYARLWQTMKPESPIEKAILENHIGLFAICDDNGGSFDYWIAGIYRGGDVPEGLELFSLPESDWALFSTTGALPKSLQELNDRVWQNWYPNEGKELMGSKNVSLEFYSPGDMQNPDYECGIWVPIEKMPVGNNQ
ncbi:MAG: GyrI-like domain-containing protein [Oscillospiraceae bacterium]